MNLLLIIVILFILYSFYKGCFCKDTEKFTTTCTSGIIGTNNNPFYSIVPTSDSSITCDIPEGKYVSSENLFLGNTYQTNNCEPGFSCPGIPNAQIFQNSGGNPEIIGRKACGLNNYQDQPNQTECKKCPPNTWTYSGPNTKCNTGPYIEPCDSNCKNCGYLEVGGEFGCCSSGNEFYGGYHYCTKMPNGNTCFSNAMCASGICWTGKDSGPDSLGTVGVCVASEPCNPNNGFLDGGCGSASSVIQTIEAKDGAKLTVAAINAIDNIIASLG